MMNVRFCRISRRLIHISDAHTHTHTHKGSRPFVHDFFGFRRLSFFFMFPFLRFNMAAKPNTSLIIQLLLNSSTHSGHAPSAKDARLLINYA